MYCLYCYNDYKIIINKNYMQENKVNNFVIYKNKL